MGFERSSTYRSVVNLYQLADMCLPIVAIDTQSSTFDPLEWKRQQIALNGPVVWGASLRRMLGFKTSAALSKAQKSGLGLNLFQMPRRKGWFCLTEEVCELLLKSRTANAKTEAAPSVDCPTTPAGGEGQI